jgi:hypothetical protein
VLLLLLIACLAACGERDGAPRVGGEGGASARLEPGCADIERFAGALVDTGITYDYSPSGSPAELAEDADAVFRGELTGESRPVVQGPNGDVSSQSYVGYDVEVTRRAVGEKRPEPGEVVTVFVEYNPTFHDEAFYADHVTAGIEVAIIAHHHEPLNGLVASIEGFMAGCPGGPLVGWTGHLQGWIGLHSVADVIDAVDGGESETEMNPGSEQAPAPSED